MTDGLIWGVLIGMMLMAGVDRTVIQPVAVSWDSLRILTRRVRVRRGG